jgi:hypothetical protein
MGEFRFDLEFDTPSYEQFITRKLSELGSVPKVPRFLYTHDYLPGHSQNSGTCRPDEVALFEERLVRANSQMRQDVELIIQMDPEAIIIVAGDHGPYLTKNCTATADHYDISEISRHDIQDRYGTFLAIRWPEQDFSEYDDICILQDVFPAVFAYMFKDTGILGARVEPRTLDTEAVSGAWVGNGIIHGGINDGEPLFTGRK